MEPNPYLVVSSLFLALPSIPMLMREQYLGTFITLSCFTCSIIYHATKPKYPIILFFDKIFANLTVIYGTYVVTRGLPYSLAPYSMLSGGAIILYYVGEKYKLFVWHPDYHIATGWHAMMHIFCSISSIWLVCSQNMKIGINL